MQRLVRALTLQKRLVQLLSTNDVPKLRQLIAVALRNGCSVSRLLDRLAGAIIGAYKPKGDYVRKDYDLATLTMRLGGGKLLFALAKPLGLPSEGDWFRHHFHKIPKIVASPNMKLLRSAVRHNLKELFGEGRGSGHGKKFLMSLLLDEIAIDPAVVHNAHFNCAGGACYEHSHNVNLNLVDEDGMRRLKENIDSGLVHANGAGQTPAKEALVVSIASFSNSGYHAKPVVILASCKSGDAKLQQLIIETVESVWEVDGYEESRGELSSAESDGDPIRRELFAATETCVLDSTTRVGETISELTLFDLAVAPKQRTRGFDTKHIWKRIRGIFKSFTRGTVAGWEGGAKVIMNRS